MIAQTSDGLVRVELRDDTADYQMQLALRMFADTIAVYFCLSSGGRDLMMKQIRSMHETNNNMGVYDVFRRRIE